MSGFNEHKYHGNFFKIEKYLPVNGGNHWHWQPSQSIPSSS